MLWKIYKITCNINGKSYIGNTRLPLEERWRNGRGYQKQRAIYSDILKYGWDNFTKELLCECNTLKESRKLEAEYIKKFNTIFPNGYNVLRGCFNICDSGEDIKNICQIDKNGELVKIWANSTELKKEYSINQIRTIRSCVFNAQNNKLTLTVNYFWVLEKDFNKYQKEDFVNNYKRHIVCSNYLDNTSKQVFQFSLEGELIKIYKTRREVTKLNPEYKRTSILNAIKNKKPYKGYFWSYTKSI